MPVSLKRWQEKLYNEQVDHHFVWRHYSAVGLENDFVLG